jgi:hypothetical protein
LTGQLALPQDQQPLLPLIQPHECTSQGTLLDINHQRRQRIREMLTLQFKAEVEKTRITISLANPIEARVSRLVKQPRRELAPRRIETLNPEVRSLERLVPHFRDRLVVSPEELPSKERHDSGPKCGAHKSERSRLWPLRSPIPQHLLNETGLPAHPQHARPQPMRSHRHHPGQYRFLTWLFACAGTTFNPSRDARHDRRGVRAVTRSPRYPASPPLL